MPVIPKSTPGIPGVLNACMISAELYYVLVGQDLDEIDQSQNTANTAEKRQNDSDDTFLLLAHHEVVNTETAQEEAQQSHGHLVLTIQIVSSLARDLAAARQAYLGILVNGSAAIRAEGVTLLHGNAALQTDSLIVIHGFATILTEHKSLQMILVFQPK